MIGGLEPTAYFILKGPRVSTDQPHQQPHPPSPVETLFQFMTGYWVSQCVYVAAVLGVADHLEGGPMPSEALASRTGTHAPTLYRLLRALASVGVLAEDSEGFSLTPVGALLKSGPTGLRAMAIHLGENNMWMPWGNLLHTVQTGENAFKYTHGQEAFPFLAEHPESSEPFNEAMTNFSMFASAAVTAAYDFSGIGTLVDAGAGHGSLLAAVLKANPSLKGIAFDLPQVVEGARAAAAELGGRMEVAGGDFFEAVPSGDAHILKSIIHDWDDERARQILRNIHKAQKPGGKVLLVEIVVSDGEGSAMGKLADLHMLVIPGGKERTGKEFQTLFEECGFRLGRVVPTETMMCIVEGIRV